MADDTKKPKVGMVESMVQNIPGILAATPEDRKATVTKLVIAFQSSVINYYQIIATVQRNYSDLANAAGNWNVVRFPTVISDNAADAPRVGDSDNGEMSKLVEDHGRLLAEHENLIAERDRLTAEMDRRVAEGVNEEEEKRKRHNRDLTMDGLAAARKEGMVGGRPRVAIGDELEVVLKAYRNQNISASQAYKSLGISKATFYRIVSGGRPDNAISVVSTGEVEKKIVHKIPVNASLQSPQINAPFPVGLLTHAIVSALKKLGPTGGYAFEVARLVAESGYKCRHNGNVKRTVKSYLSILFRKGWIDRHVDDGGRNNRYALKTGSPITIVEPEKPIVLRVISSHAIAVLDVVVKAGVAGARPVDVADELILSKHFPDARSVVRQAVYGIVGWLVKIGVLERQTADVGQRRYRYAMTSAGVAAYNERRAEIYKKTLVEGKSRNDSRATDNNVV